MSRTIFALVYNKKASEHECYWLLALYRSYANSGAIGTTTNNNIATKGKHTSTKGSSFASFFIRRVWDLLYVQFPEIFFDFGHIIVYFDKIVKNYFQEVYRPMRLFLLTLLLLGCLQALRFHSLWLSIAQ